MNPVNNERLINRLQRRLSQMNCAIPNKKLRMDMGDIEFIHLLRAQIDRYANVVVFSPCFYVAFDLDQDDVCSICLENVQNEDQICYAQCRKHVMHSFCLTNYLESPGAVRRCPTCRVRLDVYHIINDDDDDEVDDQGQGQDQDQGDY
jgi:hypothetical protein